MNTAEGNLAWADALLAALAAAGLRHLVLAPGARSAPLALAALRRPEIECHVVGDERAAGFFALGLGKASGLPAAVLVTSGTAAANLLPAAMEANLAAVPLLLLTADRPAEAIGWGANQAVEQARLFGEQVRACHVVPAPTGPVDTAYLRTLAARLLEECRAPLPGPVHANLPFREPLLPDRIPAVPPLPATVTIASPVASAPEECTALSTELSGKPGVIVCGEGTYPPGFAAAIASLAARLDAPIIADPLANLRHGAHDRSHVLAHAARFLRTSTLPTPLWVLRFGNFPVSRVLERWLDGLTEARHILVAPPGRWPDPHWRADVVLRGDPFAVVEALVPTCRPASADIIAPPRSQHQLAAPHGGGVGLGRPSADFCAAWQRAEQSVTLPEVFFEGTIARLLFEALPAGAHCFVGNSLAIRAVDAYGGTDDKPLTLHGNRGASGIDGNLATAAGIAAANQNRIALLVGDQTLLHDCGSLALLARQGGIVVLLDNGGGGIFDHLPFAPAVPGTLFERGWIAPPRADFAALAAAFGLGYAEADSVQGLRAILAQALSVEKGMLLRVVIDRQASLAAFRD